MDNHKQGRSIAMLSPLTPRPDNPVLRPTMREEVMGLVPNVTFVEGLVRFRDQWLAYYGQGDTMVGVAMSN